MDHYLEAVKKAKYDIIQDQRYELAAMLRDLERVLESGKYNPYDIEDRIKSILKKADAHGCSNLIQDTLGKSLRINIRKEKMKKLFGED